MITLGFASMIYFPLSRFGSESELAFDYEIFSSATNDYLV